MSSAVTMPPLSEATAYRIELSVWRWTQGALIFSLLLSIGAYQDSPTPNGLNLQSLPWFGELLLLVAWAAILVWLLRKAVRAAMAFAIRVERAPNRLLGAHVGYWWGLLAALAIDCVNQVVTGWFDFAPGTPFLLWLLTITATTWSVLCAIGIYALLTDRVLFSAMVWRAAGAISWSFILLLVSMSVVRTLGLGHEGKASELFFMLPYSVGCALTGLALYSYAFRLDGRKLLTG
jgi:hypothetical protein